MNDRCRQYCERLSRSLDGEQGLDTVWESPDPEHEGNCPACRVFAGEMLALQQRLVTERDSPLPSPLVERLAASGRGAQATTERSPSDRRPGDRHPAPLATEPGLAAWLTGWLQNPTWPSLAVAGIVLLAVLAGSFRLVSRPAAARDWQIGPANALATIGTELTLGQDGGVELRSAIGSRLRVWKAEGALSLLPSVPGGIPVARLAFRRGSACFAWEGRQGEGLDLEAGPLRLEIRGTGWRVSHLEQGRVNVEVAQGQVTVVSSKERMVVPAMRAVTVAADGTCVASAPFNPLGDPAFSGPVSVFSVEGR